MQETQVRSLGWEDALEKEVATPSSALAWETPGTEEPGSCSPWGSKESDMIEHARTRSLLLEVLKLLSCFILWFYFMFYFKP